MKNAFDDIEFNEDLDFNFDFNEEEAAFDVQAMQVLKEVNVSLAQIRELLEHPQVRNISASPNHATITVSYSDASGGAVSSVINDSSKLAYRHIHFFSMLDRANLAHKIIINDVPIMSTAEKAIAIAKYKWEIQLLQNSGLGNEYRNCLKADKVKAIEISDVPYFGVTLYFENGYIHRPCSPEIYHYLSNPDDPTIKNKIRLSVNQMNLFKEGRQCSIKSIATFLNDSRVKNIECYLNEQNQPFLSIRFNNTVPIKIIPCSRQAYRQLNVMVSRRKLAEYILAKIIFNTLLGQGVLPKKSIINDSPGMFALKVHDPIMLQVTSSSEEELSQYSSNHGERSNSQVHTVTPSLENGNQRFFMPTLDERNETSSLSHSISCDDNMMEQENDDLYTNYLSSFLSDK